MAEPHRLEDDDFPAYTMGRAAELIGATPAFLRSVEQAGLIVAQRSGGGHRRYSRHQLRLAARARALADQGTSVEAACRIVLLEDRLDEALRANAALRAEGELRTQDTPLAQGTTLAGGHLRLDRPGPAQLSSS
jgi:DNA-binding transcriptional MerR regulator